MDFREIDSLIERLEKKRTLGMGSPITTLNGVRGIWRTIRGFRVFLEVHGKAPNTKLGKIIVGPPSFVGHKLDGIPGDVWEKLTPRSTLKEFKNINVADNGIDTLKSSIKSAIAPEDSRHEALEGLDTALQLVPIARSAGFNDSEIKQALKGDAPNEIPEKFKPTGEASKPKKPSEPKKVELVEDPKAEEKPAKEEDKDGKKVVALMPPGSSAADRESKDKDSKSPDIDEDAFEVVEGALARVKELASAPEDELGGPREKVIANILRDMEDKIKEKFGDLAARRTMNLIDGLESGDLPFKDVANDLQEMFSNTRNLKEASNKALSPADSDKASDRVKVKDAIESFDKKIEDKVEEALERQGKKFSGKGVVEDAGVTEGMPEKLKELIEQAQEAREDAGAAKQAAKDALSASQLERLQVEAAIGVLEDLAKNLKSPEAKQKVQELVSSLRTSPFNRRSILLRLYQLFQLLLLFIPM